MALDQLNRMIQLERAGSKAGMAEVMRNQKKYQKMQQQLISNKCKKVDAVRNRQKYLLKRDLQDEKTKFGEAKLDPIKLYSTEQRKRVGKYHKNKGLLVKPKPVEWAPSLFDMFDNKMALIKEYTSVQGQVAPRMEKEMVC